MKIMAVRTEPDNVDFIMLVKQLDVVLREYDGEEHTFFAQFNKPADLEKALVIYENKNPVACGAIKKYSETESEIKRMYVIPGLRGKGISRIILKELEKWSAELGYSECILETGKDLKAAVGLYKSSGYAVTENYGQYSGVERSLCFRKKL